MRASTRISRATLDQQLTAIVVTSLWPTTTAEGTSGSNRMATDETRKRILVAAASHFARFGFEASSLRRIADDAGIRAASIFHHFPDGKRELFGVILKEIAETVRERIVGRYGMDAGLRPEDAIVQMAAAFWDYFADHEDYAKLILHQVSGLDRQHESAIDGYIAVVIEGARAFMRSAQLRGELAEFDIGHFMLWTTGHTLATHGAPFLASYVYPNGPGSRLRAPYLAMVREHIRAVGPGPSTPPKVAPSPSRSLKKARPR